MKEPILSSRVEAGETPWQLRMFSRTLKKKLRLAALRRVLGDLQEQQCLLVTCGDNNGAINFLLRAYGGHWAWADCEEKSLAEMRQLLGAMRRNGDAVEFAPQPGLDDLQALVDEVGRAGLPVHLHIDGDPFPLSRARGLSAYRIVQEGITNALKHASASRVDVTLRYAPEELDIEVRDDGPGTSRSDGLGHGLVGIRERVKIFGGEMSAGAGPDGGFVLRARLPLGDEAS